MKGYDKLPPEMTTTAVATGLMLIPLFGFLPLAGIVAAVITSAAILDNLGKRR